MTSAAIPRLQSARVALYEQRFGKFDSGKNAYWSLRKERPVTLAEGARFDAEMRAGRLAPVIRRPTVSKMSIRAPRLTRCSPGQRWYQPPMPKARPGFVQRMVMPAGRCVPSPIAPQERLTVMPTEARRIDALPATPPLGPARPPKEPLFEAIMRQLRERQAGPAIEITTRPDFAAPGRPLAAAPAPVMAGFDMKKLALPLALIAGAFVVSRLL